MDEFDTEPTDQIAGETEGWAERPLLLAGLGLAAGVAAHLILGNKPSYLAPWSALQIAALMAVTLFAAMIGFTIERRRLLASVLFAAVVGVAGGLVTYWNGAPGDWSASDGWRVTSLLLAVAIAAPLFQAARDEGRLRMPYAAVHDYAWTNVVLWFACWLFVGIVFAMLWLLAGLFGLIKIELLRELLVKNWFWRALIGLSFGAALGLLREHDVVVRLLQRVVATVLAVLAPVLAMGLGLFLIALPFTGLEALWDATQATTPMLLGCAVGALILTNAVIGNRVEEERRNPALRFGAVTLALVILPLAILAAVATGLRVSQYGYTPERLWAIVFVGLALLYGAAYLGALLVGRLEWTAKLRPANLVLAFVICAVGLLLATPLINFNRISTDDQVARLESGRISADKFDWRALAFEFGAPGRAALSRLKASRNAVIREKAVEAGKSENRFELSNGNLAARTESLAKRLRVLPAGTALPVDLRAAIVTSFPCGFGDANCTLFFLTPAEAVLLPDNCFPSPEPSPSPTPTPAPSSATVARRVPPQPPHPGHCALGDPDRFVLDQGKWIEASARDRRARDDQSAAAKAEGYRAGQIDVRKVERRQVFVGGVPVGDAFE